MAGSFSHIVDKDGSFTMDLIENLGDAHEALEECYHIIHALATNETVEDVCHTLNYPNPFLKLYREESSNT